MLRRLRNGPKIWLWFLAGLVLTTATSTLSSNGLTDVVQWDGYSLVVMGQRIFLQ